MNAERKVNGGREIEQSRLNRRPSRPQAALFAVGFLIGVLMVSAALVGRASAAGRVVNVSCEICGAASDPIQYSFMVRLENSESVGGSVSASPLAIADYADPIQYTFAARRSANLARDAEVEGAVTGSTGSDCATLGSSSRSQLAEAARLTGLAAHFGMTSNRVSPGLACLIRS